jgi:hypothetical protein
MLRSRQIGGVLRNEEVSMQEHGRMAEEAKRIGRETQEQVNRAGQAYQNAVESGFEAASRSLSEINKGFQDIAAEITNFSRKRIEDVVQAWEQVVRARSFGDVVEVQSRYAQKVYEDYMSQMSRLGEIYLGTARNAAKSVEETSKRFTEPR